VVVIYTGGAGTHIFDNNEKEKKLEPPDALYCFPKIIAFLVG
jgi:hypothetical protein